MTSKEKLFARLRELGHDIPADTEIRRTYAGHVQRSQGAWSWFLYSPTELARMPDVGSQWPVWVLLRHRIQVSDDNNGQPVFRGRSFSVDPVLAEQAAAVADMRDRKAAAEARDTARLIARFRGRS